MNKRAEQPVLETLAKLIPKILELIAMLVIIVALIRVIMPKESASSLQTNLLAVKSEMYDIQSGESIQVPILRGKFQYVLYKPPFPSLKGCPAKNGCLCVNLEKKSQCISLPGIEIKNACMQAEYETRTLLLKKEKNAVYFEGKC